MRWRIIYRGCVTGTARITALSLRLAEQNGGVGLVVVVNYALAYYNGKMSVEISEETHRIIYIVNL